MRASWMKALLTVLIVAFALLYLSSIKKEVHIHSERLQRVHYNDSMEKMETDINRLRELKSHFGSCLCVKSVLRVQ